MSWRRSGAAHPPGTEWTAANVGAEMDRPPPDPQKLLGAWMEWERGETPPGRVMSTMKTAGMRELLEGLVAVAAAQADEATAGS